MEFFNNLWVALSTPNTGLLNILFIFTTLLENLLGVNLFTSILNLPSSTNKKTLYVILISIISLITLNIIQNPFNVVLNYLFTILFICILFKCSFFKGFIATISTVLIFGIVGFLITNPFLYIFNISSEELNSIPIYKLGYLALMYIIIALIILFLKHKYHKIILTDVLDKKTKSIIILNFVFGIIILLIQTFSFYYYTNDFPIILSFLTFISILGYLIFSIYSLTKIINLSLTTKKLETSEEYNNTLRILHDNVRGFKHDFDNIVTTIGGYIRTNDMEGLKQYYLQLEDDCQRVNNLYILNPSVVNNDGIYNLIMKKYHEAEEKDIKVNISFLLDLSTLNMKIYEFARILGILLDNAIEASSECEEKIINLTFRNDSKNSRQLIIVENTYKNKDVDTHKIFEKGVSGKENHTGLGLWEVNKILNKNKNITLFTTKNDQFFTQQLEIYYNN